MSDEEAEALRERIEKWDVKHAKQDFIRKMERKITRKERAGRV